MTKTYDEPTAHDLIRTLRIHHGLAIVAMGRADVEDRLDREITDDEWDRVRNTWAWSKGFSEEPIMESAWALVDDAISDAGLGVPTGD